VKEIGDGGAASTTVVLTQQGKPSVSADGSIDFTIGTGDASITTAKFTNRMPVGSLQLQKIVTGPGAALWGVGPFTMHVVCVLPGANPNVVYNGDVVLGGENPLTATIPNLPTGAACHVKETDVAGAQASDVSPGTVRIGDGTTVDVTATNTFTVGQITVSKKLAGAGAADHKNDTFHVSLMCVYQSQQIEIPGGDERALTVASPVTYKGLPVGSDCTVTETDNGGAAGVSMTPASPDNSHTADVVVGDGTDVQVVVTNVFDPNGGVLPVTGGDATIWLIAGGIGLVLIGGGAVLLITRRRRRA
jgi:LPXTG-motif cell wall-anchored protein